MSLVTTKMKEKKSHSETTKLTTNIEKKTREKVAKMTSNETLTMAFVLKNIKLLKNIKNCKVKLSKTIKQNAINKKLKVKLSKKLSRKSTKKNKKPSSKFESKKSDKIKKSHKSNEQKKNTPQKDHESHKKEKKEKKVKEKKVSSHKVSEQKNKNSSQKSNEHKKKVSPQKINEQQKKTSPQNRGSQSPGPIFIRLPANRTIRKTNKRQIKASSKFIHLTEKFGKKVFRCHVRVKRLEKTSPLFKKKLNTNRKTVSFLETVEIFGESSDMDTEINNSRELDEGLDDTKEKIPRTSTPIIDLLRRNSIKARRKSTSSDTKCVEKTMRRSNRLSSSLEEDISKDPNIKKENETNGNEDAPESESMKVEEICNDIDMKEVDDENMKSDEKLGMDIDDSEVTANDGGQISDSKDNKMDLETENESKSDQTKSESTEDSKKSDVSCLFISEATTNGNGLANKVPNLNNKSPTIDNEDSFQSGDDHIYSHPTSKKKEETSNFITEIIESDTNLELKTININKSSPEKHATKINNTPNINSSNPLNPPSTSDLFDLLKANKLPPEPTPRKLSSSQFVTELEISEDEDVIEPLQLNIAGTDNKDSNSVENKDSRFSLNTFFKKIKDKCSPCRPKKSPNNSQSSELDQNDAD